MRSLKRTAPARQVAPVPAVETGPHVLRPCRGGPASPPARHTMESQPTTARVRRQPTPWKHKRKASCTVTISCGGGPSTPGPRPCCCCLLPCPTETLTRHTSVSQTVVVSFWAKGGASLDEPGSSRTRPARHARCIPPPMTSAPPSHCCGWPRRHVAQAQPRTSRPASSAPCTSYWRSGNNPRHIYLCAARWGSPAVRRYAPPLQAPGGPATSAAGSARACGSAHPSPPCPYHHGRWTATTRRGCCSRRRGEATRPRV